MLRGRHATCIVSCSLHVCSLLAPRQSALDYIGAVGAVAEEAGHHPDLHLTEYRTVEVKLFTHARGGITINDLIVAAVCTDHTPTNSHAS